MHGLNTIKRLNAEARRVSAKTPGGWPAQREAKRVAVTRVNAKTGARVTVYEDAPA